MSQTSLLNFFCKKTAITAKSPAVTTARAKQMLSTPSVKAPSKPSSSNLFVSPLTTAKKTKKVPEVVMTGMVVAQTQENRAKRKLKSRFVSVNGYQVLKANNYSLEDGEPSVWSSELGSQVDDVVERSRPVKKLKKSPSVNVLSKQQSEDLHRKAAAAAVRAAALRANNEAVKADKVKSFRRRQLFIRSNWEALSPFLDQAEPPEVPPASGEGGDDGAAFRTLAKQPQCLRNVELREYQLDGINWLIETYRAGINVILGDEMGLGKTLQTIALLGWLRFQQKVEGVHLVVVPLSVLSNWMMEFHRFLPQMRVLRLHSGDPAERRRLRTEVLRDLVSSYDVVVTTYEVRCCFMACIAMLLHASTFTCVWR